MSKPAKPTSGTPAIRVLEARGIAHQVHAYPFEPGDLGIGEQAANALGVAAERIFKTLMVTLDDRWLALALVPADREANMKLLAAALGGKRAAMADLGRAQRASGYVKGGISPLGQRQTAPAVIDRSILDHASVLVNGGRRGLQIELAPADLIALLGATVAKITR